MSSKKNSFSTSDRRFMKLALNLAKANLNLTGLNPSVGCVIVKNDEIISYGQTGLKGRPHAEYVAIKNCKKNLQNSTMYVSMEPCTHYGKTPPCTNLIIKSKIKKLFYAIEDLDVRTSKKSFSLLKSKNIIVKKNLLKKDALKLYKKYFLHKKNKKPFVTGKIASSKNEFIYSKKGYVSNEYSRNFSHLLRYKNDAILISSVTINKDNPQLTCRISGLYKYSPIIFILDKDLKISKNSFIIKNPKRSKTFIFYVNSNIKKIKFLKSKGIKLIKSKLDNNNNIDLNYVINFAYKNDVASIIVEGGKNLTQSFISKKLFNKFYLFKSDKKISEKGNINISKLKKSIEISFKNKKIIDTYLDKDQIYKYY